MADLASMAGEAAGMAIAGPLVAAFKALDAAVLTSTNILGGFASNIGRFSNSLIGFVRSAIQGTSEGNRLSLAWQRLSLQIASVFKPVIDKLTIGIFKLTEFFASLTGDGQRLALIFGALTTVIGGMGPILMVLRGLFGPINVLFSALIEGLRQFFTGTKEGAMMLDALKFVMNYLVTKGIPALIGVFNALVDAVVVAFQGIVRGLMWFRIQIVRLVESFFDLMPKMKAEKRVAGIIGDVLEKQLKKTMAEGWGAKGAPGKPEERKDVSLAMGRFEGIGAAFQRVTEAANKIAGSPEEKRHAEAQQLREQTLQAVMGVGNAIQKQNPIVGGPL